MLGVSGWKVTSPVVRSGSSASALKAGSSGSKCASGGHLNSGQQGRYFGYYSHSVKIRLKRVYEDENSLWLACLEV